MFSQCFSRCSLALFGVITLAASFLLLSSCTRSSEYYLGKASEYLAKHKNEDAAINFNRAIQVKPSNADGYFGLGLCRVRQNRRAEAYEAFHKAMGFRPDFQAAQLALAELLADRYLGDPSHPQQYYDELNALLGKMLARNAKCSECLRIRGYIQLSDRHPEQALVSFRTANALRPMDDETVRGIVIALTDLGQFQEAETLGTGLIAIHKTYGLIYDSMYGLYQTERRPQDAERIFQLKIANNPTIAAYRLQLASHYYNARDLRRFETTLRPLAEDRKSYPNGRMELADYYLQLGKWPEARSLLEEVAAQEPARRQAALDLELKAVIAADPGEGLKLTDRLLKEYPSDSNALFLQATLWLDAKDVSKISQALKDLQSLSSAREDEPAYWYALGRAQLATGDPNGALISFVRAARLDATFKPARLSLAELSLANHRPVDALRYADEAMKIDPLDGRARLLRANALLASNRGAEGTDELRSLVKAAPEFETAQLELAQVHVAAKRYTEAEEIYRKFYRPGSADLGPLVGLALIYTAQGKPEQALDLLNAELPRSASPDEVRRLIAQAAMNVSQPDLAIQQYEEVLKSASKSAPDYYRLALAYRAKGDVAAAISNLQQADRAKPLDPGIVSMLAYLLQQSNRNREAAEKFREVLKMRPDDANTMNNLAYAIEESGGSLDEALQLAQDALKAAPHEPSYADTVAVIYLKKKMPDSAMQALRIVERAAPGNPTYMYHLALAELETGSKDEARATLTAALAKSPSQPETEQIRQALARISR
jgi:tetratricopeptide (TPR) repeat protein